MKKDLINELVKLPSEIRYFSKEKQIEYSFILKIGYKNGTMYLIYKINNYSSWNNEVYKPTDVGFFMCDYLLHLTRITSDYELEFVVKFVKEQIQEWEKKPQFTIIYD